MDTIQVAQAVSAGGTSYIKLQNRTTGLYVDGMGRTATRALELARAKRRSATRLGWAVQWGTVRMLGTFLTEDPTAVPASVVRFVAEQLGLDDEHCAEYGTRAQTVYEHAWEIRDTLCAPSC